MANEIEDKHRGRPPTLSRDSILAIAAKIPVEGFSLRVVADRLGVSPQSIYYYFNSKNALLGVLALLLEPVVELTLLLLTTAQTHREPSGYLLSLQPESEIS